MCPICKSSNLLSQDANIVEFLRIQCDIKERKTKSLFCLNCNFVFFERRLNEIEVSKLYSDYRSPKYNKNRLKVEPSYKDYVEMFDDKFSSYWIGRTNELLTVTRKVDAMKSKTILDFGGDGMIPSRIIPGAEISIEDPAHRNDMEAKTTFDLIYASEVFEHLSFPSETLLQLKGKMHADSKIIIDVPLEYYGSIKQEWDRQALHPGSFVNMHEHINHFSIEALKELAFVCQLKVHSIEITPLNFLIGVLAL